MVASTIALWLVGCGTSGDEVSTTSNGGANKQTTETSSTTTGIDFDKTIDISIWQFKDDATYYSTIADNPVIKWWAQTNNLNIDWVQPPSGTETEAMSLMLGTGDYTDLFSTANVKEDLTVLCDDGVIVDLAPYIREYMPNLQSVLESEPEVLASLTDDDGRMFIIPCIEPDNVRSWGGMVYRKDIIETMTNGNPSYPSGQAGPTTVEDWDYMLELMKTYFESTGATDYACLILPYNGLFGTGELITGFGAMGDAYIDNGVVKYGPVEDNFYNYLVKMKEWYEKGYIYQDFASRIQDMFFFPNTALTYGGAAGIWYGLDSQLGTALSMPEYGMNVDISALAAPIDTANNITEPLGAYMYSGRAANSIGWAVSSLCTEEKMIRVMSSLDYFYTEEGSYLRSMGLSVDEGAADDPVLQSLGLTEGTRVPGSNVWVDSYTDTNFITDELISMRVPGLKITQPTRNSDLVDGVSMLDEGSDIWRKYGHDNIFPLGVTYTAAESNANTTYTTNINDYVSSMIPRFITGREDLSPQSFESFKEQIVKLGLNELLANRQAAYNRYVQRMEAAK